MRKRELAVAVAKDVLKQIRAGKINPVTGAYLEAVAKGVKEGDDLREVLRTKVKRCEVCALGAALVSYVRLEDKVKIGDAFDVSLYGDSLHANRPEFALSKVFSTKQMDLIESAFEGEWFDPLLPNREAKKAIDFGARFADATSRLKAIMNNIIKNKGEFKPPALPKRRV